MPASSLHKWILCILLCLFVMAGIGGIFMRWPLIFRLPVPSGKYPIGTLELNLNAKDQLPLPLRIWYPAQDSAGARASYLPRENVPGLNSLRFRLARTHAVGNAKVATASDKWPVILYSPSWEGGTFRNNSLFEDLASEGFIVVAVDRPPNAGKPVPWDFSTEESFQKFQQNVDAELKKRTLELLRGFDALPGLNNGSLANGAFKGRLNLGEIGVMGYSFGGAVAAEALLREPRFRSGLNLDGTLFGQSGQQGAPQPFLFITDNEPLPPQTEVHSSNPLTRRNAQFETDGLNKMFHWLNARGGWIIEIDGALHSDFCDTPLYLYRGVFSPSVQKTGVERLQKINFYTVSFFKMTLQDQKIPLFDNDSIPEAGTRIRRFTPH